MTKKTGRNMYEVLRYYDALDLTLHHKVVIPSNWGQVGGFVSYILHPYYIAVCYIIYLYI